MSGDSEILDVVLRELESGRKALEELYALCAEHTSLLGLAQAEDEDPQDLLLLLLWDTDRVHVAGNWVMLYAEMLNGRVLTHRLEEHEVESGLVSVTPDLLGLEIDLDPIPLTNGGAIELRFGFDDDTVYHEHGSFEGPPGWLGGYEPGDLVSFTRTGEAVEVGRVDDLADGDAEVAALVAAFEMLVGGPDVAAEPGQIFLEAVATNRDIFRSPIPPLGELLGRAGLEVVGGWAGPQGTDWKPPGVAAFDRQVAEFADAWELEPCCRKAFQLVTDHWQKWESTDPVEAARALGHGGVADAFVAWYDGFLGADLDSLGDFLRQWITDAPNRSGPVRYVLGVHLELRGEASAAEAEFDTATRFEPDFTPALWRLADYASVRGDAGRALSLMRRAGLDEDSPEIEFHRSLVASDTTVGRNEQCPCGSGKKFKTCHLGKPMVDDAARVRWMLAKVERYMHEHYRHDRYLGPALYAAASLSELSDLNDVRRMAGEEFLFDLARFEGGGIADFLAERHELIPADELPVFELWAETTLSLWEVAGTSDGTLELRDTSTGDLVTVSDRSGAAQFSAGDFLLAWVLFGFEKAWFSTVLLPIDLRQREIVLEILDSEPDMETWASWYGTRFRPPTLQTSEGEPLIVASATLSPVEGWEGLAPILDRLYERTEDEGVWLSHGPARPAGDRAIRATLTRDGDALDVQTNSRERLERIVSELGDAVELLERNESEIDWDAFDTAGASPSPDPIDPEIAREIIGRMEDSWLDESVPALGGMTPRDAAADPTRIEDLERVLRTVGEPDPDGAGMTFSSSSLRRKLGLE